MISDFSWPDSEGPHHDELIANVKEYGCSILNVSGDDRPDFSYSVGLYLNFGHPEILIVGLPAKRAMSLINLVCKRPSR